jgi:hypothetical protein
VPTQVPDSQLKYGNAYAGARGGAGDYVSDSQSGSESESVRVLAFVAPAVVVGGPTLTDFAFLRADPALREKERLWFNSAANQNTCQLGSSRKRGDAPTA